MLQYLNQPALLRSTYVAVLRGFGPRGGSSEAATSDRPLGPPDESKCILRAAPAVDRAWPALRPLDPAHGKNRQAVSAIFDVLRPTKALNPVIPTGFCQDIIKPW